MTDRQGGVHPPLVLLVNNQEWTARSVESVLRPAGYAVVKAYSGRQAIEVAARLKPDLVIVDYELSDTLGLDTCRAIKDLPTVDEATPFVIATAASLSRRERRECFTAGIWAIFSSPFDPVEFLGQLEIFLSARRHVADAWESTHWDPATGLYNWNGLLARAAELIADAQRNTRWTACVALGPKRAQPVAAPKQAAADSSDAVLRLHRSDVESPGPLERITAALAEATRDADSTGMLGANDFLILAPGTDEEGAAILAKRLVEALNARTSLEDRLRSQVEFSAGYYAGLAEKGTLMAEDLLERPMEALRTAKRADAGSIAVLPFHPA